MKPAQLVNEGRARLRGGEPVSAAALFHRALADAPDSERATLGLADALRRQDRDDDADTVLVRFITAHRGFPDAYLSLGRSARRRGDHDRAVRYLARSVEGNGSGKGAAWLELGDAQRQQGDWIAAVRSYRHATTCTPAWFQPWLGIAHCMRRLGDPDASLAAWRTAIKLDGDNPVLRCRLAADLLQAGHVAAAAAEFDAVLQAVPRHEAASCGAAQIARRTGDARRGVALLRDAAAAHPHSTIVPVLRATLLLDLGELSEARRVLEPFLQSVPNSDPGWMQAGRLERLSGNVAASIAAFATAHRLRPDHAEPMLQMAEAHLLQERLDVHDALVTRVLCLSPGHLGATRLMARRAMMAGDPEAALMHCRAGLAQAPDAMPLVASAIEALSSLGRAADALRLLDETEARIGVNAILLARRLKLLLDLGRLAPARTVLDEVLRGADADATLMYAALRFALRCGTEAQIERCIARAVPVSLRDRSMCHVMRGEWLEQQGDVLAARACYEAAWRMDRQHVAVLMCLVRVCIAACDADAGMDFLRLNRHLTAHKSRMRHHSANASQTLYGQVLDDFRLDATVCTELRHALSRPVEQRLTPMLACVAANPDSTMAAIALVATLLATGAIGVLSGQLADAPDALIPRVIVQFWDTADPPDDIAALMSSWAVVNPGFEYRRYAAVTARQFLSRTYGDWAARAYDRAQQPAQKADLFRLGYLAAAGGIYVDADDLCHAQVDRLLPPGCTLVAYREDMGTLGNNFIAAAPRHPVLAQAFLLAAGALLRGDNDILWLSCGPGLLTRAFASAVAAPPGVQDGTPAADLLAKTHVLTVRELHGSVLIHCPAAYKHTEQAWQNASFKAGRAPAARLDAI